MNKIGKRHAILIWHNHSWDATVLRNLKNYELACTSFRTGIVRIPRYKDLILNLEAYSKFIIPRKVECTKY